MCFLKDLNENRPKPQYQRQSWPVLVKIFQETHVSAFHYTII